MNYKMGEERMNEQKIAIKDYQRDAFQQLPRVGKEGQMTNKEQAAAYRIAAEYLKTEGLDAIYKNLLVKADELDRQPSERDPYLVPGAICEVWNEDDTWNEDDICLKYFSKYDDKGHPCFVFRPGMVGDSGLGYQHYRVIATPWDHAPEKAEWVATDQDGRMYFYKTKPGVGSEGWVMSLPICSAGYDAAVKSGEVDWATTLRRRPAWAKTSLKHD